MNLFKLFSLLACFLCLLSLQTKTVQSTTKYNKICDVIQSRQRVETGEEFDDLKDMLRLVIKNRTTFRLASDGRRWTIFFFKSRLNVFFSHPFQQILMRIRWICQISCDGFCSASVNKIRIFYSFLQLSLEWSQQ
jgi:hypothetical protein